MLPSTGYFKSFNCPFYDSGLCERPYCHFRHIKKDPQTIDNGEILQQLVSEAVKKVLQHNDGAQPSQTQELQNISEILSPTSLPLTKATYNPTPITELNKINDTNEENQEESIEQKRRHIPVPYTPIKPTTAPINRTIDSNGSTKPFIYIPPTKYTPGATENVKPDPYLPKGSSESSDKYLPGSEKELQKYTPGETKQPSNLNYIPSDKSEVNKDKKKILEYKPKVITKSEVPRVTYQPTPLNQVPCFSSDEEEPSTKKIKLSKDQNLDGLEDEFHILDQILNEEKLKDNSHEVKLNKNDNKTQEKNNKSEKDNKNDKSNKQTENHSNNNKDDKKSKSSREGKESNTKHHSSHKEKYKDKDRHKSKEKYKSNEKKKENSHSEKSTSHSRSKNIENCKSSSKSEYKPKHPDKKHKDGKDHKSSKHKHKSHKEKKDKEKSDASKSKTENVINKSDDSFVQDEDISESDEETIALECKRIFEEYVPVEKVNISDNNKKDDVDVDDVCIPSKKRISRTVNKNVKVIARAPIKPDFKVSAAQAMAERINKIKEYHASKQTVIPVEPKTEVIRNISNSSSGNKIRIAHVPYATNMLNAKKIISNKPVLSKTIPSTSSTIAQTLKKGAQRTAHIPNDKFIDRPGVLEPLASKIPANIRSIYLNMMIDECLKIYLLPTDAYNRAQHEELNTSKKCYSVQIYKNSAVLAVNRLRKEIVECNGKKKSASECSTLQNLGSINSSNTKSAVSWSIESKKSVDNSKQFIGAQFYNNISKWIMTEEQLQENGFPRPHPSGDKGRAKIYVQNNKQKPPKGYIRTCCRCKKDYTVDKKGFAAVKEECVYHPNNKYRFRGEVRYQCCSQDGTSDGCCVAPVHVFEYVDYENLKGYVRTLPPETQLDDFGVYAIDCEMCYTTHGLDLTRVTVINSSCKVIYETLIKPLHPIIDYNTRYSGITEEQMADVKTTLLDVQATLLSMFNNKTILIGHSLESDFKALKLIHDTVIDTSVLYPHKMGPPHKRALRNLSSEYLRKIIQNSVDGHDSAEDALVCMELIIHKLKEDLKTR